MNKLNDFPRQTILARALAPLSMLLFFLFLVWLYWPIQWSFFNNDDWIILYHNNKIPLLESWRYFSLKTIWFYRPLQSLQFGITYKLAGLDPFWYNIQLLAMHLGVCILSYFFLKRLFTRSIAALSVILFSVSCLAPDILFWKANFNTLQNAVVTMAACLTYLLYLDQGKRKWLIITILLAAINCLTKESAVNLPFILGSVWLTRWCQNAWRQDKTIPVAARLSFKSAFLSLLGVVIVCGIFVITHKLFYANVEKRYSLQYQFVSPLVAVKQLLISINTTLLGQILYGVVAGLPYAIRNFVNQYIHLGLIWPVLVLVTGVWLRKPAVIFALAFGAAWQIPSFALEHFYSARYYYVASLAGLVLIAAIVSKVAKLLHSDSNGKFRTILLLVFCLIVAGYTGLAVRNVIVFQQLAANNSITSNTMQEAFLWMQAYGNQLPGNSYYVLRNLPEGQLQGGLGASEMLELATGRTDIWMTTEQALIEKPTTMQKVLTKPNHYLLDVGSHPIQLQKLSLKDGVTTQAQ